MLLVCVAVPVPAALLVTVGAAWTVLMAVLGLSMPVVAVVAAVCTVLVTVLRVAVLVVAHLRVRLFATWRAAFRGAWRGRGQVGWFGYHPMTYAKREVDGKH